MSSPTITYRPLSRLMILLWSMLGLCACNIDGPLEECPYNLQLRYDYNMENSTNENRLTKYVFTLEEYLFDERGILYAINPVQKDECTGIWVSELTLPPGRYSVIAVGNRTGMSTISDNHAAPIVGKTRREDMLLTLTRHSTDNSDDGANFANCGRLYHGYRTFSVLPSAASLVRVDMVHSHLDLRFTIRWKNNKAPVNTNDFYVMLKDLPSEYRLMPEYVYTTPNTYVEHDCDSHDPYTNVCLDVRHHIVNVQKDRNVVNHHRDAFMFGNVISGQTLSYRIRNCGADRMETTISLYRGDGSQSGIPEQLMKNIHLNDFLNRCNIDLDHTLKQQYHIVFEIDPDTGQVRAWLADIADWDEGGSLGG